MMSIYGYGEIDDELLPRNFTLLGQSDTYICNDYPVIIKGITQLPDGNSCIKLQMKNFYGVKLYMEVNNISLLEVGAEYTATIMAFVCRHKDNRMHTHFMTLSLGMDQGLVC